MHNEPLVVDQAAPLRQMTMRHHTNSLRPKPRILLVTSGKGGVGKSTFALNCAIRMATTGCRVLLVDADPNLGNLDLMLGVSPRYRLSNVLCGEIDIEDAVLSPMPGLKVLAGNSGETDYPLFNVEQHNRFFANLISTEERFDHVILDSGAGLTEEIVNCALRSDEVIVITTTEPTAVLDAYAIMKIILTSRPSTRLSTVMNMVRIPSLAEEAGAKLTMAIKHFLKSEVRYLGFVPFDDRVSQSITRQEPFMVASPRSAAALSLCCIADTFAGRQTMQVTSREMVNHE